MADISAVNSNAFKAAVKAAPGTLLQVNSNWKPASRHVVAGLLVVVLLAGIIVSWTSRRPRQSQLSIPQIKSSNTTSLSTDPSSLTVIRYLQSSQHANFAIFRTRPEDYPAE